MVRNALLTLLVAVVLANFGYRFYLLEYASPAAKKICAQEPVKFGYKNQFTNCLARHMP